MVVLKFKLKGSTLIEVIVSITIAMMVFAIAMQIFVNVMRSDNYYARLNAFLLVKKIEADCKKNHSYFDEKISIGNLEVYKTFTPYNNNKDIQLLHIQAFDAKGKKLVEHKELIYIY